MTAVIAGIARYLAGRVVARCRPPAGSLARARDDGGGVEMTAVIAGIARDLAGWVVARCRPAAGSLARARDDVRWQRGLVLLLFALACGPGSETKSGRELYLAYGCAACHGENADGRGPSAALSSVKPRDLRDVASFRGPKTAEGIATLIAFGIAEGRTGMPGYPDIPKRERLAIAEYILSLEPPATRIWVRESHPMQTIGVAYIEQLKRGLTAVTTPAARIVELHEMKTVDGVMQMSKVDRITAPPQEGAHLMLIDLARPLRHGDTIELTLTFDDRTTETITAAVISEQ